LLQGVKVFQPMNRQQRLLPVLKQQKQSVLNKKQQEKQHLTPQDNKSKHPSLKIRLV
jgi:hypothetical protein